MLVVPITLPELQSSTNPIPIDPLEWAKAHSLIWSRNDSYIYTFLLLGACFSDVQTSDM